MSFLYVSDHNILFVFLKPVCQTLPNTFFSNLSAYQLIKRIIRARRTKMKGETGKVSPLCLKSQPTVEGHCFSSFIMYCKLYYKYFFTTLLFGYWLAKLNQFILNIMYISSRFYLPTTC